MFHLSLRFAFGRVEPRIDGIQSITNASVYRQNGRTILDFTRPLSTGDNADDVQLTSCRFFIYGFGGAVSNFAQPQISQHRGVPITSNQRICLEVQPDQCPGEHESKCDYYWKMT